MSYKQTVHCGARSRARADIAADVNGAAVSVMRMYVYIINAPHTLTLDPTAPLCNRLESAFFNARRIEALPHGPQRLPRAAPRLCRGRVGAAKPGAPALFEYADVGQCPFNAAARLHRHVAWHDALPAWPGPAASPSRRRCCTQRTRGRPDVRRLLHAAR